MATLLARRETSIVLFTVILIILFSSMSPQFLTFRNIELIFTQSATIGLVSIGMMMVILFGGIDLSVGSVLALVATATGMIINEGVNPVFGVLIGILIGALCGAFNGYFISKLGIPDIIVTLATMFILRGVAVAISGGTWITNFPDSFSFFGQGNAAGIPIQVLLLALLALLFGFILHQTPFGRRIYAIGGNPAAARLSGMNIVRTKFIVYIASGVLSALAAITFVSQIGSVQASTAGTDMSFSVIAVVLIGGASIFGGTGTIVGTMFGVLMMGIIQNGLILINASPYWIQTITGLLIVIAIILNTLLPGRSAKASQGGLV